MDINVPTAAPPVALAQTAPQAGSIISSDFETFLRMLTAQARFQDPLEPLDSSEYAAQLAQFSMVEQQVLSNDLLRALTTQLGAGNMAQAAGWIGREARTTAPVPFDGTPIEIRPNPAAVADEVSLIVRDGRGAEVQRLPLPVSAQPVEWAGVASDGRPFAQGLYSFEVESRAQGQVVLSEPVETYARVTEARLVDGEPVLVLQGGSIVRVSDVTGLRE